MLYLLDANVLITASKGYYPIDQFPEIWEWLEYQGTEGRVKIPQEILQEILASHNREDPLLKWVKDSKVRSALLLEEDVRVHIFQEVVDRGYAPDLTEDELGVMGRDPFLIAYALAQRDRCVVTNEVSKITQMRHKRKIPDVCKILSVPYCDPFVLNRQLRFSTDWKSRLHI